MHNRARDNRFNNFLKKLGGKIKVVKRKIIIDGVNTVNISYRIMFDRIEQAHIYSGCWQGNKLILNKVDQK